MKFTWEPGEHTHYSSIDRIKRIGNYGVYRCEGCGKIIKFEWR